MSPSFFAVCISRVFSYCTCCSWRRAKGLIPYAWAGSQRTGSHLRTVPVEEGVCTCECWLVIQCAVFKCKPWRPDPQLLSGNVTRGVSVELAYKEVAREVTTGMDSMIHIKLLCQCVLAPSGQPVPARCRRCWSQVPALGSHKAPVHGGHPQPTRGAQPRPAPGPAVPSAKLLEFLQPEAIRSVGKGAFHSKG